MLETIREIICADVVAIICVLFAGLASWIGLRLKTTITNFCDTETKANIAKAAVEAVEQMYKDKHGAEKFGAACDIIIDILDSKGIYISESEMTTLIESAVKALNEGWTSLSSEILTTNEFNGIDNIDIPIDEEFDTSSTSEKSQYVSESSDI